MPHRLLDISTAINNFFIQTVYMCLAVGVQHWVTSQLFEWSWCTYHPPHSLYYFLLFFILLTTTNVYTLFPNFNFLLIKVFSSHVTLKTNNLLDPVSYIYGSIFGHWHFQHIYTRSTKDKNNPKRKTLLTLLNGDAFSHYPPDHKPSNN